MPLIITDERIQQVEETVSKFVGGFVPFTEANSQGDFLSVLEQDVEWFDHGFFNVRKGHEAILKLHQVFLHCNEPFKSEIKDLQVTKDGAAVQMLWIGTCKNDIIRPDGTIVMKASGRDFKTSVSFFFKITEKGTISRIDEYDLRYWDEGRPETEYTIVG